MTNQTPPGSAFLMCSCSGDKCSGAMLLIEKSTAMVLWTSSNGVYKDGEWVPGFPMIADKNGMQLWPEEKPKMTFSGRKGPAEDKRYDLNIKKHPFEDRHSPADNTCAKCRFFKDDPVHSL